MTEKIDRLREKLKSLEDRLRSVDPATMVGSVITSNIKKVKDEIERLSDIGILESQLKIYRRNSKCSSYQKYWPRYKTQCKKLQDMIDRRKNGY